MGLTNQERRVVEEIQRERDALVALASDLIGFDTTTHESDDLHRDETALQEYLASRLRAVGAETEVWEPSPDEVGGIRLVPAGLRFEGRPQMVARFAGAGGGRSLLLNGCLLYTSPSPRDRQKSRMPSSA